MLPKKLLETIYVLENRLHLDDEKQEMLNFLQFIDRDSEIQEILNQKAPQMVYKIFSPAPDHCPTCGTSL